jgi:LysR family transcriptional regulator, regulator for metE and metH
MTMTKIEVKHLCLIKTIAGTGNLTRAAEKLCLTQSALSQQLQDIEEKLEAPLFFRTSKKMILTPAGERLLQTAHGVLDQLRLAELDIGKLVHGETGLLRIGTTCLLCYKWLPSVMKSLQAIYPKIEMELWTAYDYTKSLLERELDVIITTSMDKHQDIHFEPLFEDEIVVIMNPQNPLKAKSFVRADDLAGVTLISYRDPVKGDLYQYYLAPAGIRIEKSMKVEHPQAAVEMVKAGFGVSLFPRWSVETQLKSGELHGHRFTKKGVHMTWGAASLKDASIPAYQKEFVNLIVGKDVKGG